jgi:predicted nucleic acid-binding protein
LSVARAKPRRVRAIASPEPGSGPAQHVALYVESSAFLRASLERDVQLEAVIRGFSRFFTSTVTLIEIQRGIARARREHRQSTSDHARSRQAFREFLEVCTVGALTPTVRERAALAFPVEPVRALDAIHLATFLEWADVGGPMVMASCDKHVRENARALGFDVVP